MILKKLREALTGRDFQVESVEFIASNAAASLLSPLVPYNAIQNIVGSWT